MHPYRTPAPRPEGKRWGATPLAKAVVRFRRVRAVWHWMVLDAVTQIVSWHLDR